MQASLCFCSSDIGQLDIQLIKILKKIYIFSRPEYFNFSLRY